MIKNAKNPFKICILRVYIFLFKQIKGTNRENIKHVSFGYGPHMCIGANLARIETRLVFERLLERFPNMKLGDKNPEWQKNFIFRGFENLELKV